MRIETVEYEIYKFSELDEKAKERAKQWYLDGQEPEVFTRDCQWDLEALFPNSDLKVQYSLNSCQGDGLNIYGILCINDCLILLKNHNAGDTFNEYDILTEKEIRTARHYLNLTQECISLPMNMHYCYSLADRIDVNDEYEDMLEQERIRDINYSLLEKLQNIVRGMIGTLANQYENDGYKYFYEVSDEDMEDICEANEYEFLKDGTYWG